MSGIQKQSKVSAGAAGAGGGTLMVAIGQNFTDDHVLKPWLLYLAPGVSAALSVIWLWAQVEIGNFMQEWKVRTLCNKAKKDLEEALSNPNTSKEHKENMRRRLEKLEELILERDFTRIESLIPLTVGSLREQQAKKS